MRRWTETWAGSSKNTSPVGSSRYTKADFTTGSTIVNPGNAASGSSCSAGMTRREAVRRRDSRSNSRSCASSTRLVPGPRVGIALRA